MSIFKRKIMYKYCMYRLKNNKSLVGTYKLFNYIKDKSINDFKVLKEYNDKVNIKRISGSNVLHLAFVVYTNSMWNVNELYDRLSVNSKFKVAIIVAHFNMFNKKSSDIEYNNTLCYFKNLNYNVIEARCVKSMRNFDILFYQTPFEFCEKNVNLDNISLKTVVLHTSYSYMLAGNMKKLDLPMYHYSLRYYTDSEYYKKLIEKSRYYTGNARYFGFAKMDKYYQSSVGYFGEKKVIIYAPHHSVHYTKYKSSTFKDNYKAILELAKCYSEKTYWIYKPHPLLRDNSVFGGVFQNVEEYDLYEKQWQELDNAEVFNGGDYFSVFKGSDAMITDSISFLAEYQFTGKPLLLLESGQETYNEFGQSIVDILYKCGGSEIEKIEKFVIDVVYEIDSMKEARNKFFGDNLNYKENDKTANQRIYEDMIHIFFHDGKD